MRIVKRKRKGRMEMDRTETKARTWMDTARPDGMSTGDWDRYLRLSLIHI